MVEAPKTIQEGEVLTKYGQREYKYIPKTKDMPTLNLPNQLDLPGLVQYDSEQTDVDLINPSREGLIQSKPIAPEPKF